MSLRETVGGWVAVLRLVWLAAGAPQRARPDPPPKPEPDEPEEQHLPPRRRL